MNRNSNIIFASMSAILMPLVCSLMVFGVEVTGAKTAHAQFQPDDDLEEQKAYWQIRHRDLLREAARLRRDAERERELYADANRRNYRRGPVRHEHRDKVAEAERDLARVEEELANFSDEARRGSALPGWLYEVEDEPIAIPEHHSGPDETDEREKAEDDAGRNLLHSEKDGENQTASRNRIDLVASGPGDVRFSNLRRARYA